MLQLRPMYGEQWRRKGFSPSLGFCRRRVLERPVEPLPCLLDRISLSDPHVRAEGEKAPIAPIGLISPRTVGPTGN